MARVRITVACWDYDRTRPLQEGRVPVEGVDLTYLPFRVEETFWRMLRYQDFDAAEMSMGSYMMSRDKGTPRFVAIPVFPLPRLPPLRHLHPHRLRHQGTRRPQRASASASPSTR